MVIHKSNYSMCSGVRAKLRIAPIRSLLSVQLQHVCAVMLFALAVFPARINPKLYIIDKAARCLALEQLNHFCFGMRVGDPLLQRRQCSYRAHVCRADRIDFNTISNEAIHHRSVHRVGNTETPK